MTAPTIVDLDALLAPFYDAETPPDGWRVGTEAEKFGVHRRTGQPLSYDGDDGIVQVLHRLVERCGWRAEPEYDGGPVIALRRGQASVTLEPGGQLELSGAPLRTIHETRAELTDHLRELREACADLDVAWLGLGFHPTATQADLPWVPKLRYGVMREYLPTRGPMALDMMRRTCTVQANLDYADEADAMRKLRVSLRLSALLTAMFANSPFVEGVRTGERSHRAKVWLHMDPDRSGLLPFAWKEGGSYRDYVEWALDVPMFLIKRDGGRILRNTGQTFRAFMRDGFEGTDATLADWRGHLMTLFPEVRLKNTLEIRGADSQGLDLACALPALCKGVLYDARALDAAEALAERFDYAAVEAARPAIAATGLAATLCGRRVAAWAGDLLEIAEAGLARIDDRDADGRDERVHLAPLRALIEREATPADALLAAIDPRRALAPQLFEHALA
ncbi:MAG: glutamate--cysteine ligase [Myxococcales bacterium]|nr:glutamate--cysteine ligase [Myxococcales bacterium]